MALSCKRRTKFSSDSETLENSVNSLQIELNTKSRSVEGKAVEMEKAMEFTNTEIEELKKKDKENENNIKELEDKLLY